MKNIYILLILIISIFLTSCKQDPVGVMPLSPDNLTGMVISFSQVNLNWIDNSTNENGFKIERKTGNGLYSVVATVASNVTTYSDLGLLSNTIYTYRVYAYNSAGASLTYTNEVTVNTDQPFPSTLINGLIAYYPFTGNSTDNSGNNFHGVVYGANLTTDRFGNNNSAYSFDGLSNYIEITNSNFMSYLRNAQVLSVSFWTIDNASPGSGVSTVMGTWSQPNGGFYINDNLRNGLAVAIIPNSQFFNTTFLIDPNYHHYTVIFDGIQNTNSLRLRVYKDGSLQTLNFPYSVPSTLGPGSSSLLIGARWGNPTVLQTDFWNGKIDDIRIYNRVLTQSEIIYLANH